VVPNVSVFLYSFHTVSVFNVNVGVRQGGELSAVLFGLLLDHVINKPGIGGNISTKMGKINAYVDDIVKKKQNL
jgi:hypothetical protein